MRPASGTAEIFRSSDLLGHDRLHFVHDIRVRKKPVPIGIRVFIRALEWIAPQIEHFWRTQLHEGLEPAHKLFGSLLHQHDFPIAHAYCEDVTVIADVEEELSWALLGIARKIGKQVVSVDVHLVGFAPYPVAAEKLLRDTRFAGGRKKCRQPVLM